MSGKKTPALALAAAAAILTLAGCAAGGDSDTAENNTFTFTLSSDPGALDPHLSALSTLNQLNQFTYDPLVGIDEDGELTTALASEWTLEGTTATLTIRDDVTCSDGTPFTAQTAADNVTWLEDAANQSPLLGAYIPVGATAAAEGNTLSLHLATPSPFVLQGLANLPMICDAGLADRSMLSTGSSGTGPYVLTEAIPNDHYSLELNEEYAWGPGGVSAEELGLPAHVVAQIIPNETTAANLLLSGEVNAAQVSGPDAARLDASDLFSQQLEGLYGQQWYNHADGHPTSDPEVRMALTQALDFDELQKVATSGTGTAARALAVVAPSACDYDAVTNNRPKTDVDAAKETLDDAGWVEGPDGVRTKDGQALSLSFIYTSSLGAGGTAASELAVAAWEEIGVQVDAKQQDETTASEALFGTGAWDIAWISLNVSNPDQAVGFVSGTPAPEGSNFSGIDNAAYSAAVDEAMTLEGADSCPEWQEAEAALYSAADLVLFSNNVVKTYGANAEFSTATGSIRPTSVRLLNE